MVTQRIQNSALLATGALSLLEGGGELVCPNTGEILPVDQVIYDPLSASKATSLCGNFLGSTRDDPSNVENGDVNEGNEGRKDVPPPEECTLLSVYKFEEPKPPPSFNSRDEELAALEAAQRDDDATCRCSSCRDKKNKS